MLLITHQLTPYVELNALHYKALIQYTLGCMFPLPHHLILYIPYSIPSFSLHCAVDSLSDIRSFCTTSYRMLCIPCSTLPHSLHLIVRSLFHNFSFWKFCILSHFISCAFLFVIRTALLDMLWFFIQTPLTALFIPGIWTFKLLWHVCTSVRPTNVDPSTKGAYKQHCSTQLYHYKWELTIGVASVKSIRRSPGSNVNELFALLGLCKINLFMRNATAVIFNTII